MTNPEDFYRGSFIPENIDIESIYSRLDNFITDPERIALNEIISSIEHTNKINEIMRIGLKIYNNYGLTHFRKNKLIYYVKEIGRLDIIKKISKKKPSKSTSGVLVVTILTSPYPIVDGIIQEFSCQWDCHYCPKEPNQPRSYLHDEPAVKRANTNKFDPQLQFTDRCLTLYLNGHPIDKIELLILGGTWDSYPIKYRETFIRDLIYSANTFLDRKPREKLSLELEKKHNVNSLHKIIGITIETRPDCITRENIKHLRKIGCTRVQIGVQHTNDKILKKINRKCPTIKTINAIRLLKDNCFKIDIHLMTGLPLATPEIDSDMLDKMLYDPNLQADQWKIYPCEITPWTKIKEWYDKGEYKPYHDKYLIEILKNIKSKMHPWIRLNRIVRDIPSQYIYAGNKIPNLRQIILEEMAKEKKKCLCIRCREINNYYGKQTLIPSLIIRKYQTYGGVEYFISYEDKKTSTLFGFCRLRIIKKNSWCVFDELKNMALVRELHIYGNIVPSNKQNKDKKILTTQHLGLGKLLLKKAEYIAWINNLNGVAIISGIGVRNYYNKNGYKLSLNGEFMIKQFYLTYKPIYNSVYLLLYILMIIFNFYLMRLFNIY